VTRLNSLKLTHSGPVPNRQLNEEGV
jgi:hypothetical protein